MYTTISSVGFYSHLFCQGFMFYLCLFYFYVNWCPSRFPFQMMFVSFNSYTTGITSGAGTANLSGNLSSSPHFNGIRVARSLFSV
jgi:hypothetical protein